MAETFSRSEQTVFPEDLVSDPVTDAKLLLAYSDRYNREMLSRRAHILAEVILFWCAGDERIPPRAILFTKAPRPDTLTL
jgi:hypothetical protein